MRLFLKAPLVLVCMLGAVGPVQAQTGILDQRSARFFSHEGNTLFLIGGVLQRDSRQRLGALATNALLVHGLKYITRERRPDGSDQDSFPSGHASAAFVVAGMAAARAHTGTEAALWYLGAGLIADSRVTLRRHWSHDVIVGAALGLTIARTPGLRIRF